MELNGLIWLQGYYDLIKPFENIRVDGSGGFPTYYF